MNNSKFSKAVYVFTPFLLFVLLKDIIGSALAIIISLLSGNNTDMSMWITIYSGDMNLIIIGVSAFIAVLPLYRDAVHAISSYESPSLSPIRIENDPEDEEGKQMQGVIEYKLLKPADYIIPLIIAICMSIGVTFLLNGSGLTSLLGYSNDTVSTASLPLQLAVLGLLTPVCEEIVFRLLTYRRMRENVSMKISIIASALLFGVYHGNPIQFIFASIMGIVLVLTYIKYDRIIIPILMHCASNIAAVFLGLAPDDIAPATLITYGLCLTFAGTVCLHLLLTRKRY